MARTNTVRKQAATSKPAKAEVVNVNAQAARNFGKKIGAAEGTQIEEADSLHAAWKRSDDKGKAAIRAKFFLGYFMGRLGLEADDAAKAVKNTKHRLVRQGASQKFLYLIARTGAKAVGGTGVGRGKGRKAKMRVPGDVLGLIEKVWVKVPGKSIADQRDLLIEAVKQLSARYVEDANKQAASA